MSPVRLCPFCLLPLTECLGDDNCADIARPAPGATRDVQAPRCRHCLDDGMVCEDHPEFPFGVTVEGHRSSCGAGMPRPACCSPIPEDGTHSIAEAFTPDWQR
jgi:hypothetical protein